jgi:hypothetical protein
MLEGMKAGDGWRVPPNPCPPDASEVDLKWILPRRLTQSVKCAETPLRLRNGELILPRSFVYCTRLAPGDPFRQFAERARHEPGWRYYEIDASHSPHVTAPETLRQKYRAHAPPLGRRRRNRQAVLFLVETDFITGDCIRVDGGRHLY